MSSEIISNKELVLKEKTKQKYLKIIATVASNWLYSKPEAENCLSYLNKRVKKEYHKFFNFGYFPNELSSLYNFMDDINNINNKIDPKIILEESLFIQFKTRKPKIFFYNNPLLIPFYDSYGNVVSVVGRSLLPNNIMKEQNIVKYKNLPFKRSKHVFGLNLSRYEIVKKDSVIIVEGQFDMISGYINGIKNIIAVCGSKLLFDQILLLKRYTNNFKILFDNDEAGEKGWKAVNNKTNKTNINLEKIILPDNYKDLDDAFSKRFNFNNANIVK